MSDQDQQLGPIDADKVYPLEVFQKVSGLGKAALRTARNGGLKIRYAGGRGWVLGKDWIDHVIKCGQTTKGE